MQLLNEFGDSNLVEPTRSAEKFAAKPAALRGSTTRENHPRSREWDTWDRRLLDTFPASDAVARY
ncbi:hypothetical protein M0534_01845 [Methylonatrum kenyense]|uniref:hypothetical protein n=1 Tax=Methylonatrum kenyense TaxID=455253 RepID=UPI0020BEB48D|nr:hypothetical protein [Methylonatrum kenyense]MCK8515075.1 hypothetical protein [Methylonatrum kenyense]